MEKIPDVTKSSFWNGSEDLGIEDLINDFALEVKRSVNLPISISRLETGFDNIIRNEISRVKEEESREYNNHMHCQDGKGQL